MNELQLEFNLTDASDSDVKLSYMQKQIDAMSESMGKVRRKMFADLGEMKKQLLEMKAENELLRTQLREYTSEKTEWQYGKDDYLFQVK